MTDNITLRRAEIERIRTSLAHLIGLIDSEVFYLDDDIEALAALRAALAEPPAKPEREQAVELTRAYQEGYEHGSRNARQEPPAICSAQDNEAALERIANKVKPGQVKGLLPEALAEPESKTPAWWMDGLTVTLMREGVNKHRAREIAVGYWEAYCQIPGNKEDKT